MFLIDVNNEILIKRLSNTKKRPLCLKNLKETINKIYFERKKIYNEADFRIKSSFLTIEEIVKKF